MKDIEYYSVLISLLYMLFLMIKLLFLFIMQYHPINHIRNSFFIDYFLIFLIPGLTVYAMKSQLINLVKKHNSYSATLNVFNIKLKRSERSPTEYLQLDEENNKNFVSKPKHYPPANKEWFNSIYCYNKNTTKLLPTVDHVILKLIKSYFNLYSRKLEKKIKSRRLRIRVRRLSTNRILVSRPEVKHTNDKVIITIYVYNRQKKYYLNKINRIVSIDQIDNLLPHRTKKELIETDGPWPSNFKIKVLRKKSIKVRSKVRKHKNMVLKMLNIKNKIGDNKFKSYEIRYLKDYVTKSLRREIFSTYFRQLLFFNKSKFDERYLLPLTRLTKKVYNKKIEFNLVDLKYLYLNSYIFSETLVTKIRNRKNRLLRVLKTSLLMFKLPLMDRIAVYDEIYNRKRKLQNLKVQDLTSEFLALQFKSKALSKDNDLLELLYLSKVDYDFLEKSRTQPEYKDILEFLLSKVNSDCLQKLRNYHTYSAHHLRDIDYPSYLTNTVLSFIKHKYVSGIRLEVAGRLTRRNTAARSVFKLRYKGNIKNMDSSYKGLPTVLLRGYAKSNLQYTNLKSKIRIGSFGLKGWVSAS